MKAKKKKSLTAPRNRALRKSSNSNKTKLKKTVPVSQKNKKAALKKKIRVTDKSALKETPKKSKVPTQKYYITINGKKIPLEHELIKKYNLRPGDFLPFSHHKVFIEK
jgi:hypothetical protein